MSSEIRISVVVNLPDDPTGTAKPAAAVFRAWEAFTEAVKSTEVMVNDFYIGPVKQRRHRRRGRPPRLAVAEPPSAA